ncbi:MAG: DUF1861 family protein [Bacillota bacterium]|nr:DUF1861 family protein [Bacillota bacterium]
MGRRRGQEESATSCVEGLLAQYREAPRPSRAEVLRFSGVGRLDVYNITAPFFDEGRWVLAGRVEKRFSEVSEVRFFTPDEKGAWRLLPGAPAFPLQDPFVTRIHGELLFGGVETFIDPEGHPPYFWRWRTVFFRGESLSTLRPFARGPIGMKDIRLVELEDGTIGVFTRPQGERGGRGKIGFFTLSRLDDLQKAPWEEAPLLEGLFSEEEWGGANEAQLLPGGKVLVLGHVARFGASGHRHYYPMAFVFDPKDLSHDEAVLLGERQTFLPGPSKHRGVRDVVFPGGLHRIPGEQAVLYAGISDAGAQRLWLPDIFAHLGYHPHPLVPRPEDLKDLMAGATQKIAGG